MPIKLGETFTLALYFFLSSDTTSFAAFFEPISRSKPFFLLIVLTISANASSLSFEAKISFTKNKTFFSFDLSWNLIWITASWYAEEIFKQASQYWNLYSIKDSYVAVIGSPSISPETFR